MGVVTTRLRSDRKAKLGRKGSMPAVLGAAAMVVMLMVVKVTLHQHRYTSRNQFSVPHPDASQHTGSLGSAFPHTDGSSDASLLGSFCVGQNCKGMKSKKEAFGALKGYVGAAEGATGEDFQLPTRPRAGNQKLYQKDVTQQLNSTWTEEARAAWVAVLQARRVKAREACRRARRTGGFSLDPDLVSRQNLVWVTPRRLVWCPVFKAASTTWVKNLLLASGKAVVDRSLHAQLRQLYPAPASTSEQERILRSSMRMIVVRHPFERLLSAYRDKMLRVKSATDPFIMEQQMVARSYWDKEAQPVPYTAAELKKASSVGHNLTGLVHPTFTQFLKKVHDDIRKIWRTGSAKVNLHWRPFWVTCEPCHLDYDVIAHVETLTEDQEFVIREMGLQDLLRPAHTHASRFDGYNDTSEAAKIYFRKVPLELVESLATLLHPDFELFGYSPSKYLSLAALRNGNTSR